MNELVFKLATLALAAAVFLGLWRLVRGPGVLNRIIAFDVVTVSVVGWMALLSLYWQTIEYLELILVFTLLGFVGTVALTQYLRRTLDQGVEPAVENSVSKDP